MLRHLYLYKKLTLSHGFNILFFTGRQCNQIPLLWIRHAFVVGSLCLRTKLTSNLPPKRENGALRQEAYRCLPPSGDSEQMTRCMRRPRAKHDGTHDLRYFITCQFNLIIYSKERALVQSFSY